ncbi:Uncharacterised protein [Mycobacteroides abscessus subsp. abscessus]|nr:Uncharacterised protein [Mycobacteroides abscessus subsp. abscessus]
MPTVHALVEDGHQSRMPQPGHRTCLQPEAREKPAVGRVTTVHHLDGDGAIQPGVQPSVHGRHAARRDRSFDAIPTIEHRADHRIEAAGRGLGRCHRTDRIE